MKAEKQIIIETSLWKVFLTSDQPPKPQVHWHFRPRYNHSVEFSGKIFKDPNFGYHYLRVPEEEEKVPQEMLKLIALEIKKNL